MYDGKATTGTPSNAATTANHREIIDNSSILNEVDNANDNDGSTDRPATTTSASKPYRCRGEGLTGRTTRWSSLAVPGCRGKWLRLTVGQPKKCSKQSQFIFV